MIELKGTADMKKLCPILALMLMTATPAFAQQHRDGHALGNMYTHALNAIAASDMPDTQKHAPVKDIHMDHGQVFVTLEESHGTVTAVYDPIANKLVPQAQEEKPGEQQDAPQ